MEYYSAIKKECNFAFCSDMDELGGGHYAKGNESNRRQVLYDITCKWSVKNATNQWIKQKKQIHRFRAQTSGYWWGGWKEKGAVEG